MTRRLLPVAGHRQTARLALRTLSPHRAVLVLACLAFAAAGLAGLVAPWVLGDIVDLVRADEATGLGPRVGLMVGAAVAGGVFAWASVVLLAQATEPALATLRESVLDRALALDGADLEDAGSGDLVSRLGDDVRRVSEALTLVVPLFVESGVAVVLTAAGIFALDWRLGLAGLVAAPAYYLAMRWYLPRSSPYYARERTANGELTEVLVSGVHAAGTLRAYRREQEQTERIRVASEEVRSLSVDVFRLLLRFFGRFNRAEYIGLAAILTAGYFLVRGDLVTVGAVTAAALYFHRLFNPIMALLGLLDEVQAAGAALARLAGVALLPAAAAPEPRELTHPAVRLAGVGHEYEPGRPVLKDVRLDVAPGETGAVVGESGAGKSTLGAVVAGVLAPTTGTVTLGGHPLTELPLRDHVAVVTQEVHVFGMTVRENVDLARDGADEDQVRAALDAVGATPWVRALPEGLDTVVGDDGHRLTTAQAQQLALARVLLRDPAVVVLDEATAEAGSSGARVLERAAAAVVRDRGALVIAHRLTQAAAADRILVMDSGRVVEEGSHEELVTLGGRYATLWRTWSAT